MVWRMVLHDMHIIEYTYISLLADVASLTGFSEIRGSYEGLQWCLNEAPKLEKYTLECLELDRKIDVTRFPVWLKRLAAGCESNPELLRYLRQLLLFCYKAYVTHDSVTTRSSMENFALVNSQVAETAAAFAKTSPRLLALVRKHCMSVLYKCRFQHANPGHGPGAVTTSKDKWLHRYSTIEALFPYSDWFATNSRDSQETYEDTNDCAHITAKLIAVPKDSRGPRLICVHPAEAIWIQQAVRKELERAISSNRSAKGPWPRGSIRFNDQSVNGRIALASSRNRRYATIDMKEASDRIPDVLVQALFGRYYKYFGCCRAQKFYVSGDKSQTTKDLHCYAPMGNATTFPVQSLVFWAICVASLQLQGKSPNAAFVFGDDIIIPSLATEGVIDALESFGLVVNRTKSFWRGSFRESCGVDAYKGVDVTPVRWKASIDAEHLSGLQQLSDIAMRLRIAGYETAAGYVYATLRKRLNSHQYGFKRLFLTNDRNHGGIAEYSRSIDVWKDAKWSPTLHWYYTPTWHIKELPETRKFEGSNHLLESLCRLADSGHSSVPDRSVSRRTRLVRGWTRVA